MLVPFTRSPGHAALGWMLLVVVALWSGAARAEDGSRDAWVIWASGARPVLLLGPQKALLPGRSFDWSGMREATRLSICTERGCEIVTARERVFHEEGVFGLELSVMRPLADLPTLTDPTEIRAALRASKYSPDEALVHADRQPELHEMPNSLAPPEPFSKAWRQARRNRRPRRRAKLERRVDWSEPSRWSGEVGAMGGLSLGVRDEGPVIPTGFASLRGGFRYLRRFRGSSPVSDLVRAASVFAIGTQVGADLRVHYLGSLPDGHHWALTTNPALLVAFPYRRAVVGGRVTAPLGLLGFGVGGVGRDVGFVFQPGLEGSLLVKPRFGLDLRCFANINTRGDFSMHCGLGGFFR